MRFCFKFYCLAEGNSPLSIAHEVADAAIVGPLFGSIEITGRELIVAAMVGYAFAADSMARAARIGAVAVVRILLLIHTIHVASPGWEYSTLLKSAARLFWLSLCGLLFYRILSNALTRKKSTRKETRGK